MMWRRLACNAHDTTSRRSVSFAFPLLVVIAACGDDPGTPSGESPEVSSAGGSTANELCFNTINEYRTKAGLRPYTRWASIESCADGEAKSDASSGQAHGAFPSCGEMAQNECPATPGQPNKALPLCLRAMIDEGPGGGHHDAMLSTKYTKVACGVVIVSGNKTWSVQNFK